MANYEGQKNLASAIQSYIVAVGIVCGGFWAIYKFTFEVVTSLTIELETKQMNNPKTNNLGIYAQVLLKNDGNRHLDVILDERALIATKVTEGATKYKPYYTGNYSFSEDVKRLITLQNVQPSSSKKLSFYIQVNEPGNYLVEFSAVNGWAADAYVSIK